VWVPESIGLRSFQWQVGYSAFTERSSDVEVLRKYIRNNENIIEGRHFRKNILSCLMKTELKLIRSIYGK
jgi:hypothetical protein